MRGLPVARGKSSVDKNYHHKNRQPKAAYFMVIMIGFVCDTGAVPRPQLRAADLSRRLVAELHAI